MLLRILCPLLLCTGKHADHLGNPGVKKVVPSIKTERAGKPALFISLFSLKQNGGQLFAVLAS